MNLYYISEFNLPSNKAYSIHVFKMLDSFTKQGILSELLIPNSKYKKSKIKIKKFYGLKNESFLRIKPLFKKKFNLNTFNRFVFGLKSVLYIKKKAKNPKIIITRSLISSFFLSLFSINHFVEIHQELKGLTKFLLINLNFIRSKNIIKVIFISKGISNFYNLYNKSIVLHDGVDLSSFKKQKKIRKIRNITYVGSLYHGRGINMILKIARRFPNLFFTIYGKRGEIIKNLPTNLKIKNFVDHSKVPAILSKSDLLIMPYSNRVYLDSKNYSHDISKFTSPLKMFEYLASGTPIVSSNLKVLREVLKNNYNSILVNNFEKVDAWEKSINQILKNKKLLKKISINAKKTAKNFTWDLRVKRYITEYKKNI